MLIATDLDRTLIPNGQEKYDGSLPRFFEAVHDLGATLLYASGRNIELLNEAIENYPIETPDFFLGDVGTVLYKKTESLELVRDESWDRHISENQPKWNRSSIVEGLNGNSSIELQEEWKQNPYKVSYYINDTASRDDIVSEAEKVLEQLDIAGRVVYSVDPLRSVGLLDILPRSADKAGGVDFLREKLGLNKENVVYCGDSGNDILPLTAGFKAVVVNNAPEDIKHEVARLNKESGSLYYIADGQGEGNGNYSSGILEGLRHFGYL